MDSNDPNLIVIPQHLQDVILNKLTHIEQDTFLLDTEDRVLWEAIHELKARLDETALALYQLALVTMAELASYVMARVMFEDERLNTILDTTVMTTDGKVMMLRPTDYGMSWMKYEGEQPIRYQMSLRCKARKIIHNGKTIIISRPHDPVLIPQVEPTPISQDGHIPDTAVLREEVIAVNTIQMSNTFDNLRPEAQLAMVKRFHAALEDAIQNGNTHHVL